MKRLALGLILALACAAPASAGKASATVSIDDPTPVHGQLVTFTVTTNASPTNLALSCEQDGIPVLYGGGLIYSASTYSESMSLASAAYTGGEASCLIEVKLVNAKNTKRWRTLGSLAFTVAP